MVGPETVRVTPVYGDYQSNSGARGYSDIT